MKLTDLKSNDPVHRVFRIEHRVLDTHVSLHYVIDSQRATSYIKLTKEQAENMILSDKKVYVKQCDAKLHEIMNWTDFFKIEKGKFNFSYLKNPSFDSEKEEDE